MATWPRLVEVVSETVFNRSYANHGKFRSAERHCIFKYTLDGEGVFRSGRVEHRVPAGSGFLCEIADPKTAYYYPREGRNPWTFVWIAFDGAPARQMVRELTARHGPVFELPENHRIIQRLLEFRKDDRAPRAIAPAWGARVVVDLLLTLGAARETPSDEGPECALIERAQEAVAGNLGRNINVKELARLLGVSREHLTRKFKEQTGMTPHDYLLRQKMLFACHLLKETSMRNKEVAQRLGYAQPTHFSRTFKRVLDMPPARFRVVGTIPTF